MIYIYLGLKSQLSNTNIFIGGTSNAYTTSEHTNFHFDVPSEHFVDALKRFVSFFQCPILRESSIQNELEIIQSEHEKNRWNDVWRTNQVERTTANPFHVFSHFSTGTRQTLTVEKGAERSLRYELFHFYRYIFFFEIPFLLVKSYFST